MAALSPETQALIDAATAAGRVRVIPNGVSGEPSAYHRLKDGGSDRNWTRRGRRLSPEGAARRARVLEMAVAGTSAPEMARRLGQPLSTIRSDVNRLRADGHVIGGARNDR